MLPVPREKALICPVIELVLFLRLRSWNLRLFGSEFKKPLVSEQVSREQARRSIVTNGSISAGQKLTAGNLTTKRPAHGISPLFWDEIVGRIASKDLPDDYVLSWSDLA